MYPFPESFVLDDLLDGATRADAECLELDLDRGHTINEQQNVVPMVAVVGVDSELIDDLEGVLAPVRDVQQRVVQRRAIISHEAIAIAKRLGGGEDVWSDDLVEETLELGVSQADAV